MGENNNNQHLIRQIMPLILQRGVKGVSMDAVAGHLGISKRTLYEIFDSKEAMIREALRFFQAEHSRKIRQKAMKAGNAMEAMALALKAHQIIMSNVNVAFFRDMDERYPELRPEYEMASRQVYQDMHNAINTGIQQGVFRTDVDYRVTIRLFFVQMESLKRMEQYFPPDVTLLDAYNAIGIGLLRSIASPKGMEILNSFTKSFANNPNNDDNQQENM